MKILAYGAGVIGTLYAARLQESGQRVTGLARGRRLADIRTHSLVLEDVVSPIRSTTCESAPKADPTDSNTFNDLRCRSAFRPHAE
jgi:2-dehydropantoate 2-reductase